MCPMEEKGISHGNGIFAKIRRRVFHKCTVILDEEEEMKIPSGIQI